MWSIPTRALGCALLLASLLILPTAVDAASVGNPLCPGEEVLFNPGNGEDIVVPDGFKVSVFAAGLNFPTGIAFRGDSRRFEVYVLESGAFGPSRCDNGVAWQGAGLPGNPFTPDIRVFDRSAKLLRTLGKPTDAGSPNANAFQPSGPAADIAFELGLAGGRLFATDNGANGGRILNVDPTTGKVTQLITGLPAGPTGQLALHGGWIYWAAGSTTNKWRRRLRWRAARDSLPGHHSEPKCLRCREREFYQRLLPFRAHEQRGDDAGVLRWNDR